MIANKGPLPKTHDNKRNAVDALDLAKVSSDPKVNVPRLAIVSPRQSSKSEHKRYRARTPHKALDRGDCGNDEWQAVLSRLGKIEGLVVKRGTITLKTASKLGEDKDLRVLAEAIKTLVDAKCILAAYKLLRMCQPSMRLPLMDDFLPAQTAAELKTSKAEGASKARHQAFSASAYEARSKMDLPQLFKLLPLCSRDTRQTLSEALIPDQPEMAPLLSIIAWISDRHAVLSARPSGILLSHEELDGPDPLATRRSMPVFPVLTPPLFEQVPDSLRSEALRVAVDLAMQDADVARLSELASLANEIDPTLAGELRSHIMQALTNVPERWEQAAMHGAPSLLKILQTLAGRLEDPPNVDGVGRLAQMLLAHTPVDQHQSNILLSAVTLVASTPKIEQAAPCLLQLHAFLSLRLPVALVKELQVRLKWALKERLDKEAVDANGEALSSFMAEVLQIDRMAHGLQQALRENDLDQAKKLIYQSNNLMLRDIASQRLIDAGFESMNAAYHAPDAIDRHDEVAIPMVREVLQKLGFDGDDLRSQLRAALPSLCASANGLEFILASEPGRRLAAQVMVDHLLMEPPSDREFTALFAALAHQIDLLAAMRPLDQMALSALLSKMTSIRLKELDTKNRTQWQPGWRLLLAMNLSPLFSVESDQRMRSAAMAIDAAAAGAEPGATGPRLDDKTLDGWIQDALGAMLKARLANGPLLLSDGDLHHVMRAIVKDKELAKSSFNWIEDHCTDQELKLRLYTAAAYALAPARSSFELDAQLPADDAAPNVARRLTQQAVAHPELGEALQLAVGRDAWKQLWMLATAPQI